MKDTAAKDITLITSSNPSYVPGLLVAISSAIRNLSAECKLDVVVFAVDMDESHRNEIRVGLEKDLSAKHTLRFQNFDTEFLEGILGKGCSLKDASTLPYYPRLFVGEIDIHTALAVYCDADIIVEKDLSELLHLDMKGNPIACVIDRYTPMIENDRDLDFSHSQIDAAEPYFNSGFLLIDVPKWRKFFDLKAAIEVANTRHFRFWDQPLLNLFFHKKWTSLGDRWNRTNKFETGAPQVPYYQAVNYHSVGFIKPWHFHRKGAVGVVKKFYKYLDRLETDLSFKPKYFCARMPFPIFKRRLTRLGKELYVFGIRNIVKPHLKDFV